jgi:putative ABC transport system permease protein
MRYLPLVWSNLKRKKLRTAFTLLSIVVAFVLFGYLGAIEKAFSMGVDVSGADRLMVMHKMTFIQLLPISYEGRIAALDGVDQVAHLTWFGGVYKDPKNTKFGSMAVSDTFFDLYPEYVMPDEQMKAWRADRSGAVVGRLTAERYGWKVGDKIPLQGTIFRKQDGSPLWEFTIDGIFHATKKGADESSMYFHYDYLNEAARGGNLGLVGWYIVRIEDPNRTAAMSSSIDGLFANSPAETKTQTEKAMAQSFANQVGSIGTIITGVLSAVFFTILLVAGNTMAQSVRERTNELAVLKTLGFSHGQVLALVLAESCFIALLGGALGLGLAWLVITLMGDPTGGFLPLFYVSGDKLALGAVLALLLGIATGLLPALQAMRLRIVDALRRV